MFQEVNTIWTFHHHEENLVLRSIPFHRGYINIGHTLKQHIVEAAFSTEVSSGNNSTVFFYICNTSLSCGLSVCSQFVHLDVFCICLWPMCVQIDVFFNSCNVYLFPCVF